MRYRLKNNVTLLDGQVAKKGAEVVWHGKMITGTPGHHTWVNVFRIFGSDRTVLESDGVEAVWDMPAEPADTDSDFIMISNPDDEYRRLVRKSAVRQITYGPRGIYMELDSDLDSEVQVTRKDLVALSPSELASVLQSRKSC